MSCISIETQYKTQLFFIHFALVSTSHNGIIQINYIFCIHLYNNIYLLSISLVYTFQLCIKEYICEKIQFTPYLMHIKKLQICIVDLYCIRVNRVKQWKIQQFIKKTTNKLTITHIIFGMVFKNCTFYIRIILYNEFNII